MFLLLSMRSRHTGTDSGVGSILYIWHVSLLSLIFRRSAAFPVSVVGLGQLDQGMTIMILDESLA
jgi:hypothetical protein